MRAFLAGFFDGPGCRRTAMDALAQRIHRIHDVRAAGTRFGGKGLAVAVLIDEIDQGSFVLTLELHPSEIQRHVLRINYRRFDRMVEIQTADAVRQYGRNIAAN